MADSSYGPFGSEDNFNLAGWFVQGRVPKSQIKWYCLSGVDNSNGRLFRSNHTLRQHQYVLDQFGQYLIWAEVRIDDSGHATTFNYRNIIDCVRYLTRQVEYSSDKVYTPIRESDSHAALLYSKMPTAYWLCDIQV